MGGHLSQDLSPKFEIMPECSQARWVHNLYQMSKLQLFITTIKTSLFQSKILLCFYRFDAVLNPDPQLYAEAPFLLFAQFLFLIKRQNYFHWKFYPTDVDVPRQGVFPTHLQPL